jgi:predicted phage tail protein
MSIDTVIAVLIYLMVQAVVFGIGTIAILATPLGDQAMTLMPWMIGLSMIASIPIARMLAPRLRARYERRSPAAGE